jgi:hypothetical protein
VLTPVVPDAALFTRGDSAAWATASTTVECVQTAPQTIVLMPANMPHAVHAAEPSRMLLIMLREAPGQGSTAAAAAVQ